MRATPYALKGNLRNLPTQAKVKEVQVTLKASDLSDADKLKNALQYLKDKGLSFEVTINLSAKKVNGALNKTDVQGLADNLPVPTSADGQLSGEEINLTVELEQ